MRASSSTSIPCSARVYGHARQGGSFGHTKISGRTVLRRDLSPLAVTISTRQAAPVPAGVRLRAGRAGSARGAASMLTADPATILVRSDSACCSGTAVAAVVKTGARFSFTIVRNPAVDAHADAVLDVVSSIRSGQPLDR
jgi:hypothetical protein